MAGAQPARPELRIVGREGTAGDLPTGTRPWEVEVSEPAVDVSEVGFVQTLFRPWHRPGLFLGLFFTTILCAGYYLDVSKDGKAFTAVGAALAGTMVYTAILAPRRLPLLAIAYLPFNKFFPMDFDFPPGNMTNVLLLCGTLAWLTARIRGVAPFPFDLFDFALLGYVVTALMSIQLTHSLVAEASITDLLFVFKTWLSPILFYYFARGVLEDRDDAWDVVVSLCWTATLVGLLTWRDGLNETGASIDDSRVAGIIGQPNNMGAFLAYYGVPMFALFASSRIFVNRCLYIGGFLVAARALLFTFSRGAYLAMAGGAVSVLLLTNPVYVVVGGGLSGAVVVSGLIPTSITDRLGATVSTVEVYGDDMKLDASNAGRVVLWKGAIEIIKDHPLRGVGMARFPFMVDQYTDVQLPRGHARDAHNSFLLTAAEMGLPGLFFLLSCLIWLIATALRLRFKGVQAFDRRLGLAFLGTLGAIVVSCMFGSRFSDDSLIGCFWVFAGTARALASPQMQSEPAE